MQVDAIRRSYARWAPVYDLAFGRITNGGRRLAAAHVNRMGGAVLEVGVGTGLAFAMYAPAVQATGIDVSTEMLAKAQEKVTRQGLRNVLGLHQMDARAMTFADESFDHVAAMHIMSVVPEPEKVLSEIVRVCRVGGSVMIANHFAHTTEGWGWVERLAAPLAHMLGWHSDFARERVMGDARLRLEEEVFVPPFGLMTYLRFRRIA
ncbi:MAG: class I SAM-dependent methyltransferase [Rhodobacteraceae bacterium]|jgi:phosphatidylethanolamine/phosphatidyl-N-methylethanolamine N-methyltransferase|nr:class I SAM-dependent methyltransferase [Paracoccaceae bacterium]